MKYLSSHLTTSSVSNQIRLSTQMPTVCPGCRSDYFSLQIMDRWPRAEFVLPGALTARRCWRERLKRVDDRVRKREITTHLELRFGGSRNLTNPGTGGT